MHLTNYAVNKESSSFIHNDTVDNDDVGHKRSLTSVFAELAEKGVDVDKLWGEIQAITIKSLLVANPFLVETYRAARKDEVVGNMCFEILGLDILLDHMAKPWLLEFNSSPSFSTDSPLDRDIKKQVIEDALRMLDVPNLSLSGIATAAMKTSSSNFWATNERLNKILKDMELKPACTNSGRQFTKIYPTHDKLFYDKYLQQAYENYKQLGKSNPRVFRKRTLPTP